ncbi:hypothetical protein [Halosimplex marinum]|uniref:hypothetical protein n=1 Tax=Halosimplex marinum TaxID=3396620 RepID=UPI003F56801E
MAAEDSSKTAVVEDQEGYVDKERKRTILENRAKIDEVAESVFPGKAREEYPEEYACRMYHEPVRTYLMSIEPLLRDFSLKGAEDAYLNAPLGKVTLAPPPEFQSMPGEAEQIKDRGFRLLSDPIEPETKRIEGLKEVIEREGYSETWKVHINWIRGYEKKHDPPQWQTVSAEEHMPRMALINAVRVADEFLQEANVGLSVGGSQETEADYSDIDEVDSF